jgi:trk system potassium uptake protein TrkH
VLLTAAVLGLSIFETHGTHAAEAHGAFLPHLFEVTSALATVGLSMDMTPTLGTLSRLMLVGLMFLGRVGPLAFFAAISLRGMGASELRPAREDIIVG